MDHSNQHYVPVSYLKAWCDPNCPNDQEPFVWCFSKDGNSYKKKSPKNLFKEKNFYTIETENGQRDLTLEKNLSRVENLFERVRTEIIDKHKPFSKWDHFAICVFLATMFGRTKLYREHWRTQYEEILEWANKFTEAFNSASPEKRTQMQKALSSPPIESQQSYTIEDIEELQKSPIQNTLNGIVHSITPILLKFPYVIIETSIPLGFVTSDNPCVWFDPATYQNPRPFGAGGLISPTIEITFPISPSQLLFLGKRLANPGIFLPINDPDLIDTFNRRTIIHSLDSFIVNHKAIRPKWFRNNPEYV